MKASQDDISRWVDAVHVRHGPGGSGAVRQTWYVLYVIALLAATYGVAVTRGMLLQLQDLPLSVAFDRAWLLTTLVIALLALTAFARWAGAIRGPVVPELVWIELVVTSAIDRALVLREPWRVSLLLSIGGSSIIGVVLGFSAWVVGLGASWILVGGLSGPLLGWWVAVVWLSGQASASGARGGRTLGSRALRREIGIDVLRRQSLLSRLVHGSVLIGDLRGTRLGALAPRTRGRTLRLRSGGPVATVLRRDLLGYRRAPGAVVSGVVLVALGMSGLTVGATQPDVPIVLTLAATAATYLGCGCWCGGLRMQTDRLSAPALLGVTPRRQAVTHLIAPFGLGVGVATAVSLPTLFPSTAPLFGSAALLTTPGLLLVVLFMCLCGQLWAATRSISYLQLVTLSVGPVLVTTWYAVPLVSVAAAVGVITAQVGSGQGWWIPVGLLAAAGALLLGIAGVDREIDAQRA